MKQDSDRSLEIVILLILGIFMFLFGLLLFEISSGRLPYSPDSTYGLFLVLVSFQVITLGKTPFGDLRRSWALVIMGVCAAILGMFASFIPGQVTGFARALVGIVLFFGGTALLVQLLTSERKAKVWMRTGGLLQQLTVACGLVYTLTIASGLITLFPGIATYRQTAVLLVVYGVGFFYLSWCIWKVHGAYPPEPLMSSAENTGSMQRLGIFRNASLPLSLSIVMLLGILLTLLGLLLFPVNLGLLAFSPDGQLGLLLTVMAIQMMSLGDTPLGQFKRSWPLVIAGLIFAALGVTSSIVPGILTGVIQALLGLLNVIGGAALLINRHLLVLRESRSARAARAIVPRNARRMVAAQTALNYLTMAFGISMLVPGLVPGLLAAGLLVMNGLLLFILASDLWKVTGMQSGKEQPSV